ncbi:MAG: methyltransferase domain-containing protein [Acidobacteria bacterium]|nr:methyltransferase domain-containing protein [Acidobacteriota bacterium]
MTACPVCTAGTGEPFLVRDPVPVHQNLLVRTEAEARALNRGRLALHACEACGFVFNASFDPALLSYGASYENTQSCSPAFEAYVEELAGHVVDEGGVRGSRIVEIGCGKGAFIRALVRRDPENRGIGFDPSYLGPDEDLDGRVRFEKRFYDESCAGEPADAVVCRHVLEHIPDPVGLLRGLRTTLGSRPARIFFETPCVEWILANEVIWDFFYEHCSYFSVGSLTSAFQRAGFEVDSVRHTFGGQYLWLEAHPTDTLAAPRFQSGGIPALAVHFARVEGAHTRALRERLQRMAVDGPIAMWGAAAKGVTLANLVDPERRLITCIVDLNPSKQGGCLPGTGHPIVGPLDLGSWHIRTAVVTNPNYFDENERLLRQASLDIGLVDLMHPGEVDAHSH